ncbi:Fe2+ transport protein [Halogeometricum rufum]|uniref:Fe2+ transport protein n=1 Tax=Halogeometricum rufum TaxID=553469 RepID=A0A1I6G913_9EURY|nr:iron transporter [Halogeometricum rufum]SFR38659.1 Fe2+ transport protein [Halogeometricum rufum]
MDRRRFLSAAGAAGVGSLAGCIGVPDLLERRSREPPVVADRPAAVYVPTHVDSMEMAGTTAVGDLRAAVTYSYPHRFWVVERDDGAFVTKRVAATAEDSVHLMVSVWEPETGLVVPNTGLSVAIRREGELVSQEVVYPMLSQRMGVHYGANFPLDGDGTYEVEVSVGGLDANRFGSFAGRFADPATGTVALEFATRTLNDITSESLADRQGERGAVRPMEMATIPVGRAPETLPGASLGRGTSGDAAFLGSVVSADRFGDDPYVVVSPRTPHNGLVLPGMALEASIDGGASFDGPLGAGLDPELGFHYGAPAPGLADGETAELRVETPPQVARHEGYETAFLDMPTVTLA